MAGIIFMPVPYIIDGTISCLCARAQPLVHDKLLEIMISQHVNAK